MRKLILTAALSACTLMAAATDYRTEFYNSLQKADYTAADSILAVWQAAAPDDPETLVAQFNSLLNRSRTSMLGISSETDHQGEHLLFADSLGQPAGSIYEYIAWDDSLYNAGIDVISNAVTRWPDRLDMRWGMAMALSMRENWSRVADVVFSVLERSRKTNFAWTWTDGKPLDDEARTIVNDGAFDYTSQILAEEADGMAALADSLANSLIALFPTDCRTLNILGALRYNENDLDHALDYFMKADSACPGDGIIARNIAYLYFEKGDNERALEWYTRIEADPQYDDDTRRDAREMISIINNQQSPSSINKY